MRLYFYLLPADSLYALVVALSEKKQLPFSMEIGNVELGQECFPEHSRMGTARMKRTKK